MSAFQKSISRILSTALLISAFAFAKAADRIGLPPLAAEDVGWGGSSCGPSYPSAASLTALEVAEAGPLGASGDYQLLFDAREGLRAARQFCSERDTCDPNFLATLNTLQDRADALERAIPQGRDATNAAIQQLSPVVLAVCSGLGGACGAGFLDGLKEAEPKPRPRPAGVIACRRDCLQAGADCRDAINRAYSSCVSQADQFMACWQRVPYPEGQAFPQWLRDEFNRNCLQYVQAGRLPAARCAACQQTEREGGCPQFFTSGQLCDQCTWMRCEDNPSIVCSCSRQGGAFASWNFTQCDICRWFNLGYSLNNLSKANNCSPGVGDALYQCGETERRCLAGCGDIGH